MSSKGTRVYTFRLPPLLMSMVQGTVQLRNDNTMDEPWTLSDFVRKAIEEKIAKMDRSRRRPIAPFLQARLSESRGSDDPRGTPSDGTEASSSEHHGA